MKYLGKILLGTALALLGAQAHAIAISPTNCDTTFPPDPTLPDRACYVGSTTAQPDVPSIVGNTDLNEVYKAESNPFAEEGGFAGNYNTVFSNTSTDPEDATISYTGGNSIDCPECWLLVKDGNATPTWYIFDISDWDGTDPIVLTDFWVGNGAISNVAIYSNPAPGPLVVMAIGLIGMITLRRAAMKAS